MRTAIVVLVLVAVSTVAAAADLNDLYDSYDRILAAAVHDELVDYDMITKEHAQKLKQILDEMGHVERTGLDEAEQLAFLINLYNASMLDAVVDRLEPDYSPAANDFAVFDEQRIRLGGTLISLNTLEHELIRGRFDEERIHVALVCGARSCPPLADTAYRGDDLEARLEARMRAFLNDPFRNRVDVATRTLYLSQIFEWFAEDFGGLEDLPTYVDQYREESVGQYEVRFIPYSWELNRVAGGE